MQDNLDQAQRSVPTYDVEAPSPPAAHQLLKNNPSGANDTDTSPQNNGLLAARKPADAVQRASIFLLERATEDEAEAQIAQGDDNQGAYMDLVHPGYEPEPGTVEYARWILKKIVSNLVFRLLIAAMIITDIIITIVDLATGDMDASFFYILVGFVFSWCFVAELCMRAMGFGIKTLLQFWYNILDGVIIIASTAGITFLIVKRLAKGIYYLKTEDRTPIWYVIFFLRVCRLAHFFRLYAETELIKSAARQLVSQNKRRYHSDGFDLDLTYVTDRVIAMSFPSSGHLSFYRNPIGEVVRFFETKHKGHYKIFNLCKERGYNAKVFGGRVERFHIADHNVPTCKEMLKFAAMSSNWLDKDPENVIAVHCKGGKGRTGTMICVYLVDKGLFSTAEDSLSYFGSRRTDLSQGKSFQGVETPSQCRYVGYYEAIRNHNHKLPPDVRLTLRSIRIWGIKTVGKGDGSDITLVIETPEQGKLYENHFGRGSLRLYDRADDELFVTFQEVPMFYGDVRFKFKCSSRKVPRGYENTAWFFWFHTGFIQHNRLRLERAELDNPHKSKTWDVFQDNFSLECNFRKSRHTRSTKLRRISLFLMNKVTPHRVRPARS